MRLPLFLALLTVVDVGAAGPPRTNLALWFDASDPAAIELKADKTVICWKDKSGNKNHARAKQLGPKLVAGIFKGKAAIRFQNKGYFVTEKPFAKGLGSTTVFVVCHRPKELNNTHKWQRLICCYNGSGKDHQSPNFALIKPKADAFKPEIVYEMLNRVHRGPVTIGAGGTGNNPLVGDIAEILVYSESFYVEDQIQAVRDYVKAKYGVEEDRNTDWNRKGPLGKIPRHVDQKLPLSDQTNKEKWTPYEPMWDEFDGDRLDDTKWWDHNPFWYGRAPGRFLPENVKVRNGEMQIIMKKDSKLPVEKLYKNGPEYKDYSSGTVVSKYPVLYGYFEIKAKPMDSAGSSAWWFTGSGKDAKDGMWRTEIDCFEIGGKAVGHEHKYNMNLHIFETPMDGKKHWNRGGKWEAPFRLADDYHVYGLYWGPKYIRYYMDGIVVRSTENTHWHTPIGMLFDSECMFSWLGKPKDNDLPSTFKVKYVRAWKNDATRGDWKGKWTPRDLSKPTKITDYVRKFRK